MVVSRIAVAWIAAHMFGCSSVLGVSGEYRVTASEGGAGGAAAEGGAGDGGDASAGGRTGCSVPANDCDTAEELYPWVLGDVDLPNKPVESGVREATGTEARWFRILVLENSSNDLPMSYSVSLSSPAGSDWDLSVRTAGASASTTEKCAAAPSVAPEAATETLDDFFLDDQTGGNDDSTWLTIEVVHASGDCGPWSLAVDGHTMQ